MIKIDYTADIDTIADEIVRLHVYGNVYYLVDVLKSQLYEGFQEDLDQLNYTIDLDSTLLDYEYKHGEIDKELAEGIRNNEYITYWEIFNQLEHDVDIVYKVPQTYVQVSGWLAHKLEQHGEPVTNILDLDIWGRCTFGQLISCDGVIKRIASELKETYAKHQ